MDDIRAMPEDFAPELIIADGTIRFCIPRLIDGQDFGLAFAPTGDPRYDGKLLNTLRESIWQASELVRLGRADELRHLLSPPGGS